MDKHIGLWVNHRKAVIVTLIGKKAATTLIQSNVEGHFRLKGGSRSKVPYGPQDATSESGREERYKHHLQEYYERIIKLISDAKGILIFGPGEARDELKKEIEKHNVLAVKVVGVESADKMTEPQIAAKVKKFFEWSGENNTD
ncbi:MAG: hypothetical protein ABH952_00465 [Candidatus Omnitrophota bacterium]